MAKTEKNQQEDLKNEVNAKKMLEKANAEKRKIKYLDRVKVEVVRATKYYREGQIINPHRLVAEQLVSDGVGKILK